MQLVYYPHPILLETCIKAHIQPTKERAAITAIMWKIMRDNNGIGLAANQVGLNIRMFAWLENEYPQIIWNPILNCVSGMSEEQEGCLSLPEIQVTIQRATSSILSGEGINGLPLRYVGTQITTRIWQHEIDHLNGKLIIDDMNSNETISNKKALKKLLKKAVA